jgi:threonyl-tRNA synthetase
MAAPKIVPVETPFPLATLRHSVSHLMASAVEALWPGAKFGNGPAIEHGFYYDIELAKPLEERDLERLENEMRRLAKKAGPMVRSECSRAEAEARLTARGQTFKLDTLKRIPEGEKISFYAHGGWEDLCEGPHIDRFDQPFFFKLQRLAGAYWMGDEKNPMLQRIYGTAFWTKEDLEAHLAWLIEVEKRDHRVLGRTLELFHIDEMVGQGLILWLPKGAIVRQELQAFISAELKKQGYFQVFTPHIGKLDLYRTSGHFPYYKESQYPPVVERDELDALAKEGTTCAQLVNKVEVGEIDGYLLKPMNCPHHIRIYASAARSYRELPLRLAEFGTVYRWEQSGEIGGMTRVRGFTQDDAHLFVREDQLAAELIGCLSLVKLVFQTLGMDDYRVRVGLRDPDSSKYVGDKENWDKAEEACRAAARTLGVAFSEEPGEAAFYGPKIDFVVRDAIGRSWQLGTVQVDYNGPIRFDLTYTGSDNHPHRPVMIHRAPFGSMERFTGVLIEHFAGKFPFWLAPTQVAVIPIREQHAEYGRELAQTLTADGLRVQCLDDAGHMNKKIKGATHDRVPFLLIVGEREVAERTVTVRQRDKEAQESVAFEAFRGRAVELARSRRLELG